MINTEEEYVAARITALEYEEALARMDEDEEYPVGVRYDKAAIVRDRLVGRLRTLRDRMSEYEMRNE